MLKVIPHMYRALAGTTISRRERLGESSGNVIRLYRSAMVVLPNTGAPCGFRKSGAVVLLVRVQSEKVGALSEYYSCSKMTH